MVFNCPEHEEDKVLLNKESWKYFDFGKKTEFNFHYHPTILPNNFSNDTFKEFISGKYMEHTKLNELQLFFYRFNTRIIYHLIVEVGHLNDLDFNFDHNISILGVL
jgi:hypothetical protein